MTEVQDAIHSRKADYVASRLVDLEGVIKKRLADGNQIMVAARDLQAKYDNYIAMSVEDAFSALKEVEKNQY